MRSFNAVIAVPALIDDSRAPQIYDTVPFAYWYNRVIHRRDQPNRTAMPAAYHVIIADDDGAIRALIARVVVRTYPLVTISAVPDGLDALVIYQQRGADLVISNHEMPVLSGLSLIKRLRVLSATLPIIMVSAHQSVEPQARALGVTDFLLKPFHLAQLIALLTSVLPP